MFFFSFGDSSCQWLIYIFFLFWNLVESPLLMSVCSFCLILFSGHIWAGFSNSNLRRQDKIGDICQSVSHTILFIWSIFVILISSYTVGQIEESLFLWTCCQTKEYIWNSFGQDEMASWWHQPILSYAALSLLCASYIFLLLSQI